MTLLFLGISHAKLLFTLLFLGTIILFLIILWLFSSIITGSLDSIFQSYTLPSSFSIDLCADYTSSGGDKLHEAYLTFKDGELVTARQTWKGNPSCSCTFDPARHSWVQKNNQACCVHKTYSEKIPVTLQDLKKKMQSGAIMACSGMCDYEHLCYKKIAYQWFQVFLCA